MKYNKFLEDLELIDSDHKKFSTETPLRDDAFDLSDEEKMAGFVVRKGEFGWLADLFSLCSILLQANSTS